MDISNDFSELSFASALLSLRNSTSMDGMEVDSCKDSKRGRAISISCTTSESNDSIEPRLASFSFDDQDGSRFNPNAYITGLLPGFGPSSSASMSNETSSPLQVQPHRQMQFQMQAGIPAAIGIGSHPSPKRALAPRGAYNNKNVRSSTGPTLGRKMSRSSSLDGNEGPGGRRGTLAAAAAAADVDPDDPHHARKSRRGRYKCSRCGEPKTNHVCTAIADKVLCSVGTSTVPPGEPILSPVSVVMSTSTTTTSTSRSSSSSSGSGSSTASSSSVALGGGSSSQAPNTASVDAEAMTNRKTQTLTTTSSAAAAAAGAGSAEERGPVLRVKEEEEEEEEDEEVKELRRRGRLYLNLSADSGEHGAVEPPLPLPLLSPPPPPLLRQSTATTAAGTGTGQRQSRPRPLQQVNGRSTEMSVAAGMSLLPVSSVISPQETDKLDPSLLAAVEAYNASLNAYSAHIASVTGIHASAAREQAIGATGAMASNEDNYSPSISSSSPHAYQERTIIVNKNRKTIQN